MKQEKKDFLEEKLKFSHYVLFWCNRELELNNDRLLKLMVQDEVDKSELINIKRKLKYVHSKINFEKKQIFLLKKALTQFDK